MEFILSILTFFTSLGGVPSAEPVKNIEVIEPAVIASEVQSNPEALPAEVLPVENSVCVDDAATDRVLSILFENAQGRIQPVLLTDGSRTKEMEKAFAKFKSSLSPEMATVFRDPRVISMDPEMRVVGEAFADGINASAVRNKLQMFDHNVQVVVYTDFVFSGYNHRDPTGVYFRNQFDILNTSGDHSLFNSRTEANALMWLAYLSL
jgi:hypothetical protein